jgi:hypothetical protein
MGDLFVAEKEQQRYYSTSDLREMLRKKYAMPEYLLMEEVRDAAGFKGKRSADAIAMAMWESRGLEVIGFEIKASRSDWLRELKNPEKAESIAGYCDRWFILAAPGCVKVEEVPAQWGLIEPRGRGLTFVRPAPKREPRPLDRSFVAAMMRRCGEIDQHLLRVAIADEIATEKKRLEDNAEKDLKARTREFEVVKAKLAEVKEATGIDLLAWQHNADEVARAIRFALDHDLGGRYGALARLKKTLEDAIKEVVPAIEAAGALVRAERD